MTACLAGASLADSAEAEETHSRTWSIASYNGSSAKGGDVGCGTCSVHVPPWKMRCRTMLARRSCQQEKLPVHGAMRALARSAAFAYAGAAGLSPGHTARAGGRASLCTGRVRAHGADRLFQAGGELT